MESDLFPESLRDDMYEREIKEGKIAVLAHDEEGMVAGYVFSAPHYHALSEYKHIDPRMSEEPDALYIQSIAIRKELQGRGYFSRLMNKFLEEAGGRTITMHARVSNNCSIGMQKNGATRIHSVENWHDSGETFDHLIIPRGK